MKRVGVIMGGPSSERDVSLNSGRGILAALKKKNYDAVAIDWKGGTDGLGEAIRREKIDVAWIALHGTWGEDGCVQGLLECYGVPLIEEYVKGREINVGVLDDEALGEVEIRPAKEFYDYEAKYLRDDTQYLVPAPQ